MKELRTFLRNVERKIPNPDELLKEGWWIYRGQSRDRALKPTIGRRNYSLVDEENRFERFKLGAAQHQSPPSNDWGWLALAQHHGCPTRMLDFTINPLVALYFACAGNLSLDGMVYAVRIGDEPFRLSQTTKNTAPIGSSIVYQTARRYPPPEFDTRIHAQQSVFIIFPEPNKPLERQISSSWEIKKIAVSAATKDALRQQLGVVGFERSRLFRDLDSLGEKLAN